MNKARKIISEIRYIPNYKSEINRIEIELRKLDESYRIGPVGTKCPMNWDRIEIHKRDGSVEDARYSAPKNKVSVHSNLGLFDYEDDLNEELTYNRLALKKAERYEKILTEGEDGDFIRDYLKGDSLTKLTHKYQYANPHTKALRVINKKLNIRS